MSIPRVPAAFSSLFGMGGPLGVYPAKKAGRWVSVSLGVLFLLGALVAFLFALWNAYDRWQRFGPAVILNALIGPLLVALVLGAIALMLAWSAFNNWQKAAVVYQNGLAYRDRKGVRAWNWHEINALTSAVTKHYTNGVYTGTTHVYTLINKDGQKMVLNDSLQEVEALAGEVRKHIFPLLYDEYTQAYNTGQVCSFGPVKISKAEGIQVRNKAYPWQDISEVSIQRGVLSIKKKDGGWFSGASAPAGSIPNLEVMLSIIDQVVGLRTG